MQASHQRLASSLLNLYGMCPCFEGAGCTCWGWFPQRQWGLYQIEADQTRPSFLDGALAEASRLCPMGARCLCG